MDPKDIELVKAIIIEALKAHSDGMVPFAWVSVVCGGLVSVIGVLWAWGFKQSNAWVAKIEELGKEQRARDDEREVKIRERYEKVIEKLAADHKIDKDGHLVRIDRLELAKDAARDQYNAYRKEAELWTRDQLIEVTKALEESAEVSEAAIAALERRI